MKAIVIKQYGSPDVLQLSVVSKPEPKEGEVRVKIHASTVGYGDVIARRFNKVSAREFNMPGFFWLMARLSFGWNKPSNPMTGSEFAGEVDAIGAGVTQFKVGDAVLGYKGSAFGAHAEYVCISATGMIAHKPHSMSYSEAAGVTYGGITALNLLRKVTLQPGAKILINGASGAIGAAAIQLAKSRGAEVTAVCSTAGLDYVKALGADIVIDYTQEDFTRNGKTYDVIFDILGRSQYQHVKKSLTSHGRYLLASFKMKQLLQMLWTSRSDKKVICALSGETQSDLVEITSLIDDGKYQVIIDRQYPMEKVADAHRYRESNGHRGSVIINIIPE